MNTENKGEEQISLSSLKKSMKKLKIQRTKFDKYNCDTCHANAEVCQSKFKSNLWIESNVLGSEKNREGKKKWCCTKNGRCPNNPKIQATQRTLSESIRTI